MVFDVWCLPGILMLKVEASDLAPQPTILLFLCAFFLRARDWFRSPFACQIDQKEVREPHMDMR
jgi:hypothetical protein